MVEIVVGELQANEHVPEDVYASWSPSPAPNGQYVAFVSDRGGQPAIWIHDVTTRALRPLAAQLGRVQTVHWSPDGEWLACLIDASGASRLEAWVVRPDGSDAHLVAGAAPGTAFIGAGAGHGWTPSGQLLVTETIGGTATALLADPKGEAREVLTSGPLLRLLDARPVAEPGGGVRALVRGGTRGQRRLEVAGTGGRRPLLPDAGPGFTEQGFLSADAGCAYLISNAGREFAALVEVDLTDPSRVRVVAERPDADLERAVPSMDGVSAVLVWNVDGGRSAVSTIDLATGTERYVVPLPRDVVDDCCFRPDGQGLLLTAEDWADPKGVWSVDLATAASSSLSQRDDGTLRASRGATQPEVEAADLISPELRRFPARDGLELSGWLYRPTGPGPWPTLIYLHGGPESQERPIYNSLYQSLVAEDIAVLALNFRGSSGLGRSFQAADDLEKRFDAISDVADAAGYLVLSGVAVAGRIGCMGRSYGGYLTLAALAWHPDVFAAGVDICGMANFHTFYEFTEPWLGDASFTEYGHPERDFDLLTQLSPITRIDDLVAPLLIIHGAEDTNVPVIEARQVDAALTERGVEHRLMLVEGEGHDFLATPNRVAVVQAAIEWLTRHLLDQPV